MVNFIHFGTVMALAALVLLILATISTPVVYQFSFLSADLWTFQGRGRLTMGVFGACFSVGDQRVCTPRKLVYNLSDLFSTSDYASGDRINLGTDALRGMTALTGALIIHAVAAVFALFGFLLAALSGFVGHLLGSLICFMGAGVATIALAFDLGIFLTVRSRINEAQPGSAKLDNAFWFVVGALPALILAGFTVCFEAPLHRRQKGDYKRVGRFPWST